MPGNLNKESRNTATVVKQLRALKKHSFVVAGGQEGGGVDIGEICFSILHAANELKGGPTLKKKKSVANIV